MDEEIWSTIPEFSNYEISTYGRIYNNRTRKMMRTSYTNYGHVKITLRDDWSSDRYTRSVAQMVAEAFVRPPNALCDHVVVLDGNLANVNAENLVWRPRWFAWKYIHQLKLRQPVHYHNLPILNVVTDAEYDSIVITGMTEGLLFDDVWRSTYTGAKIFPQGFVFEVIERV